MKHTHNTSEAKILRQKAEELLRKKAKTEILELIRELAFQNEEKAKQAEELQAANALALKLTGYRLQQKKLKQSEQRFNKLAEHSRAPLMIFFLF